MSSNEVVIRVSELGKCYQIYDQSSDRLKQFLYPKLAKLFGIISQNYFQEFWALKDITFEIKKGETLGIIGRNGSGKSTLLQIICGTLNPTQGEVQVNGKVAALLELGSGFNPEFSGRENVYLNASMLGMTRNETNSRFEEILKFADIGEFIDRPVKTYSSGMMVRLAFAIVANSNANILIIDEALAVGDIFFVQKCIRFLNDFKKNNTLIFVSHDSSSILSLCDKALMLDSGNIVKIGIPKLVMESYHSYSIVGNTKFLNYEDYGGSDKKNINNLDFNNDHLLNLQSKFSPNRYSSGLGGVEILSAGFLDELGFCIRDLIPDNKISLVINIRAKVNISSMLVGFSCKNKLGEVLFEENLNEFISDEAINVESGKRVQIKFEWFMPKLRQGEYVFDLAVAEGTQENHVQHQWMYEALVVTIANPKIVYGMFSVGVKNVSVIRKD